MSKVAFCFPGQGSLEMGMGREIAEVFPAAREVYRIGSEASGLDLEKLCFETPLDGPGIEPQDVRRRRETSQPYHLRAGQARRPDHFQMAEVKQR